MDYYISTFTELPKTIKEQEIFELKTLDSSDLIFLKWEVVVMEVTNYRWYINFLLRWKIKLSWKVNEIIHEVWLIICDITPTWVMDKFHLTSRWIFLQNHFNYSWRIMTLESITSLNTNDKKFYKDLTISLWKTDDERKKLLDISNKEEKFRKEKKEELLAIRNISI